MKSQPEFMLENKGNPVPWEAFEKLLQINETLVQTNARLVRENEELRFEVSLMKEKFGQLQRMIFGSKSERFIPLNNGQLSLDMGLNPIEITPVQTEEVQYTRNKPKKEGKAIRMPIPAHLPREEFIIKPDFIPEGAIKIGEEITEILEIIPAILYVKRYIREKYRLPEEEKIIIGSLPGLPIPKGNAGPSLLAYIHTSKFVDHLPFYRLCQIFRRMGISLAETTLNGWFNAGCDLLEPLYERLVYHFLQSKYIQIDETPIKVLESLIKGKTHKGYYWVYHSPPDKIVCFDYSPGREQIFPREFLEKFKGKNIQTDGYAVYDNLFPNRTMFLLACMAHARRKFENALQNDKERAEYAMKIFQELYAVEREAREMKLSPKQRKKLRKSKSVKILKGFEKWMKAQALEVMPKSSIGQAITYTLHLWPRLKSYVNNGRFEIDNNLIENTIRPVAIGRKNYLFAGSHSAAKKAAMMYSFFATCKRNNINPQKWLEDVFTRIADHPVKNLDELLPMFWKPQA